MFCVTYRVFRGRTYTGLLLSDGIRVKYLPSKKLKELEGESFLNAVVEKGKIKAKSWCTIPSMQEYEVARYYSEDVLNGGTYYRKIA